MRPIISFRCVKKLEEITRRPLSKGVEGAIWIILLKLDPSIEVPEKFQPEIKSEGDFIP